MLKRLLDVLVCLLFVGPPLLFMYTYTGPFQWIAEAQLSMMGSYYESITFVLTFLLWILFLALVAWVISKSLGLRFNLASIKHTQNKFGSRVINSIFLSAIAVLLVAAGYLQWVQWQTPSIAVHVSIQDLAAGKPCPSHFITIDNAAIDPKLDHGIVENGGGPNGNTTHYLPLVPENYQPGDPVHAFVEIDGTKADQASPDQLCTGMLSFTGLPGLVRVSLQRDHLPPASGYVILQFGSKPEDLHFEAIACVLTAGFLALLALFSAARRWWRNRAT